MLLNDIRLALKDILKDKFLIVFYVLFFACIAYTVISTTGSLIYEVKRPVVDKGEYITFDMFQVGKELKQPQELMEGLSGIYGEKAFSYCALSLKTEKKTYVRTYLIFGDPSGVYPYLKSEKDFYIFTGKEAENAGKIFLNGTGYKIDGVFKKNYNFEEAPGLLQNTDEVAFIVMKEPKLSEWISEENTEVLFEIIGNTHISGREEDQVKEFLSCVGDDFVELHKRGTVDSEREFWFILGKMYPFLFILLLCYFLCTSIILDGVIQRRVKEFTLHLLQGAGFFDIVLRLILYYVFIVAAGIGLCYLLGIAEVSELWQYLLVGVVFILLLSVIVTGKLKRKDLSGNLTVGGGE